MSFGRCLILIHRYVGAAIGLIMAMWCLSGIVMIYSPYPMVTSEERLARLAPLDLRDCCAALFASNEIPEDTPISRFEIETMDGQPVLRLQPEGDRPVMLRLGTAAVVNAADERAARAAAAFFAGPSSVGLRVESIQYDQWTVGGFRNDRPLWHVSLSDPARTELYVSSRTGKVIQKTTQSTRFWGWVGAVPHWLYPTVLRRDPQLWTQVVIWTSVVGTFLTVTGIYLGITHLRWLRTKTWPVSPYRGIMYWHHVPGLIFGILALTWVLSGLLSMNPWGLLEGGDVRDDFADLHGQAQSFSEVRGFVRALAASDTKRFVNIESAPLDGKLFAVATAANGERVRLDTRAAISPLTERDVQAAAGRLAGPSATVEPLRTEDTYHYSVLLQEARLPVWRVNSGNGTLYYLDSVSGALINKADAGSKEYRWWHSALHRLDFVPALRTTVGRSLFLLPLLIGAAAVSVTGAYLGVRRIVRDIRGATGLFRE
jgi:uncharacterized iron-regulated membrane protein